MAFIMWILGQVGVAPTPEDFQRFDREFRERGHHLTLDFGGHRVGGTRWSDPSFEKLPAVGLGYEYLIDRRYHAVGFEVLGQSIGSARKAGRSDNSFFVGGGLAYYPVRNLRLFMQAGPVIPLEGDTVAAGRVGIGYRFLFFKLGMQPFAYAEMRSDGQPGWAVNFRFEY